MALTAADLEALDAAIASSELEVELEGRRVRYRSVAELKAAREHVAQVLTTADGHTRRTFRFQMTTSRGD